MLSRLHPGPRHRLDQLILQFAHPANIQPPIRTASTMASTLSLDTSLPLPKSSVRIPQLGFGVYLSDASVCEKSCLHALKSGYRHIGESWFLTRRIYFNSMCRLRPILRQRERSRPRSSEVQDPAIRALPHHQSHVRIRKRRRDIPTRYRVSGAIVWIEGWVRRSIPDTYTLGRLKSTEDHVAGTREGT